MKLIKVKCADEPTYMSIAKMLRTLKANVKEVYIGESNGTTEQYNKTIKLIIEAIKTVDDVNAMPGNENKKKAIFDIKHLLDKINKVTFGDFKPEIQKIENVVLGWRWQL